MKVTITTAILQEMVSRAVKGASQNKLIPLTSLMSIVLADKKLTLTTTDASNYLYIVREGVEGDEFNVTVQVEQFSKLVSKITSETTTLELVESTLIVTGNGTYKIELPLDEGGQLIDFPNPVASLSIDTPAVKLNLATIKTILSANKSALATTMEIPVYTNYYVGDSVISTDTNKICGFNEKIFADAILIAPEFMDLLDNMTAEVVEAYVTDDFTLFASADCVVYGPRIEGIEDFAIDAVSELLNEDFESTCKVNKADLLSALDRIDLFVGVYDNRAIKLTFTDKGLDISSKQSNGVETLQYIDSKNAKPYTCSVDIGVLISQVKPNSADSVELQYGNSKSIKIVDGKVTQIIALLENED